MAYSPRDMEVRPAHPCVTTDTHARPAEPLVLTQTTILQEMTDPAILNLQALAMSHYKAHLTTEIEVNSCKIFTDMRSTEVNMLKATIHQNWREQLY